MHTEERAKSRQPFGMIRPIPSSPKSPPKTQSIAKRPKTTVSRVLEKTSAFRRCGELVIRWAPLSNRGRGSVVWVTAGKETFRFLLDLLALFLILFPVSIIENF